VVVCAGELGPDLAGVGVLQILEDGQRLLPGLPGLRQFAGGLAGVGEVGEGFRFKAAVAGFPGDAERVLVQAAASARLPRWCSAYPTLSQA
jgi:hypothetical protein